MDRRRCACCRIRFTLLRNPKQRYCAKPDCQKKRRACYEKQKLKMDVDYQDTQTKWRYKHPDYWRTYRLQHPLYVIANRFSQVMRDQKRRKQVVKIGHDLMLANMYSLFQKNNTISCSYKINLGKEMGLQICTL
jgi:hypothetical protein